MLEFLCLNFKKIEIYFYLLLHNIIILTNKLSDLSFNYLIIVISGNIKHYYIIITNVTILGNSMNFRKLNNKLKNDQMFFFDFYFY